MTIKNSVEIWNDVALNYSDWIQGDELGRELFTLLTTTLFNTLGNITNKYILDLGCGNGVLSIEFSKLNAIVYGIDSSSKMLDIAIHNARSEKNENIFFQLGDISNKLPYEDSSFDFVVSNMVLMYCEDISVIIKEVSRVLKNEGKFIFSIVHPCFRGDWALTKENEPILIFKNNYNKEYSYEKKLGENFIKPCIYFNRPIQKYIQTLVENKLSIEDFVETSISNNFSEFSEVKYPLRYSVSANHLIIGSNKN